MGSSSLMMLSLAILLPLQAWGGAEFPFKFPHPLNQSRVCWLENTIRQRPDQDAQLKRDDGHGDDSA